MTPHRETISRRFKPETISARFKNVVHEDGADVIGDLQMRFGDQFQIAAEGDTLSISWDSRCGKIGTFLQRTYYNFKFDSSYLETTTRGLRHMVG